MAIVNHDIEPAVFPSPHHSTDSDVPLHPQHLVQREVSPAGTPSEPIASTSNVTDHIYPPVPAYSPQPSNDAPVFDSGTGEVSMSSDLQRYIMAHDHGAGVARRLPEAFPSDLLSLRSSQGVPESLPPYGANDPPSYTRRIENIPGEPRTLAMLLFKFGFLFPAFWVFGALLLISPRCPSDPLSPLSQLSAWPPNTAFDAWCNENIHTEEDKALFLAKVQQVEMKWAKRCLLALGMLLCFSVAIGLTVFAVLKVKTF